MAAAAGIHRRHQDIGRRETAVGAVVTLRTVHRLVTTMAKVTMRKPAFGDPGSNNLESSNFHRRRANVLFMTEHTGIGHAAKRVAFRELAFRPFPFIFRRGLLHDCFAG